MLFFVPLMPVLFLLQPNQLRSEIAPQTLQDYAAVFQQLPAVCFVRIFYYGLGIPLHVYLVQMIHGSPVQPLKPQNSAVPVGLPNTCT